MNGPQSGIFALGNPSHAYLEFDLQQDRDSSELVTALADVREPRTTIGGVNLVSGFRPSCGARSHRTPLSRTRRRAGLTSAIAT
ncbi:MAG: hypothetical protein E6I17_15480 [Chloroflexi bacterium]|nr:MAG: hypothetical protein E6I17_15480 [Chloroflexota bacterium]